MPRSHPSHHHHRHPWHKLRELRNLAWCSSFIFRGAKPLCSQMLARLFTESYKSWCLLHVFQQDARLNQVSAPYQWVHGKTLKQTIGRLSLTAVHHLHTCQPTNATNHSGLWPCERPRLDNVSTQESPPQTLQTGPHTISVIISTWTWKWKPSEQLPAMLTSHDQPAFASRKACHKRITTGKVRKINDSMKQNRADKRTLVDLMGGPL